MSTAADLKKMAQHIVEWREGKGFYTPETWASEPAAKPATGADWAISKAALIHTELSELEQAIRNDDHANILEEAADVVIRTLDMMGSAGVSFQGVGDIYNFEAMHVDLFDPTRMDWRVWLDEAIEAIRKENTDRARHMFVKLMGAMAGVCKIYESDLIKEVESKMQINHGRARMHGKVA